MENKTQEAREAFLEMRSDALADREDNEDENIKSVGNAKQQHL